MTVGRHIRAFSAIIAAGLAVAGCGGGHAAHRLPTASPVAATGSVHPPGWGAGPTEGLAAPRPLLAPSAEMFDTITLATVPANPFALAGYTSGFWPTYLPLRAAYPAAHTVSIAVNAAHNADCLDVEPGDATPGQAGGWALADIRAGFARPCLYSDLSEMPAVQQSLAAAGLARPRYLLWLAWYRFVPGLVSGYDAVQWTDRALGRNLDESTVTLQFLSIAQPPYAPPPPPDPFAVFPRTVYRFGRDHASEYNTARAWRLDRCLNPVRREACRTTRAHLELLLGRIYFVALHRPVHGGWVWTSPPRWGFPDRAQPLGSRAALIRADLRQTH